MDCLLRGGVCLCARNALPFMGHNSLTGHSSIIGSWVEHVTVVGRVTTCVLPVSSCNSHVKGLFLSCCAVLVARAGVMYTIWVAARRRSFSDHSRQLPHSLTLFIIFVWFTVRSQYFLYGFNNNFCTLHVDLLQRVRIMIIWDWHLVVWCMSTNVSVNLPTPSSFSSTLQKENRVSIKWWNLFQNTKTLKSVLGKSQLP